MTRAPSIAFSVVLSLTLLAACGGLTDRDVLPPEGQLLLYVDTDAWLPKGPGEATSPADRPALFQRLRVELFPPGQTETCAGCSRDFGIDQSVVKRGRASIGLLPRVGVSGYRARVRLYRVGGAGETLVDARAPSTIESVVALPSTAAEGIREVTVVLRTDTVGQPQGTLDAPIAAQEGRPTTSLVGSWREDIRRGCSRPAGDGEACVPGGALWMGDPAFYYPLPERLVALSPFFIDLTEVTVRAFRRSKLATLDEEAAKADPYLYSSKTNLYCRYTNTPGQFEDAAVNCVSKAMSEKYCAARGGGTLPSEAQFEYVAGALRNLPFPWGSDDASCEDAVFGRHYDESAPAPQRVCVSFGVGPALPGSGRRDRVRIGDREVVDLAGNLSEWIRDVFSPPTERCWQTQATLDPVCTESVQTDKVLIRGANWTDVGAATLRANLRQTANVSAPQNTRSGFRCVRAD